MSKLKNKTAFVTGGSRGIGAGIVRQLATEGADVIFTYVNSEQRASELVSEIQALGVRALAIKADTGNEEDISKAIKKASEWGIDILVNNAGMFVTGEIDNQNNDLPALQLQWNVNVHGVVHTVRNVLPLMKNGGRIISIGSTGATRSAYPGIGDYAATKAALAAYTRSWARDLGSRNITANIIQPGLINTDMNPSDGPFSSQMMQSVALGRYGEPKDVGMAVVFLASEEARYITGVTLNVDGGQTT